jgi:alpha-1,6-mannosyltransferase
LLSPVFFSLFAIYILALFIVKRKLQSGTALIIIVVFAIVFRLTLLFTPPILSTDIYRYYWEGKVIANGFNPYLYSPDAKELTSLRDPIWALLNLKYVKASYPPFLELFFAIVYSIFQSVFGYKIVFFALDLGLIATICLVLRELGLQRTNVVVYAWAPLPIIEVAQTGHNDPLVMFLVFVSFLFFLRKNNSISSHIMALSVVSKFFPAFFAPAFFKRWGKRSILVFLVTVALFYALLVPLGLGLFNGLLFAINTVYFNGSIFPAIVGLLDFVGIFENPGFVTQIITYVIYAAILLWAYRSARNEGDMLNFMKVSFALTGALLLLNRAFFPWYVTWTVPFLVFFTSPSWLLLSGTVFLGYMKYDSFPPPSYEAVDPSTRLLIDLVQYLPFYFLLVYELLRRRNVLESIRGRRSPESRSTSSAYLLDS